MPYHLAIYSILCIHMHSLDILLNSNSIVVQSSIYSLHN